MRSLLSWLVNRCRVAQLKIKVEKFVILVGKEGRCV